MSVPTTKRNGLEVDSINTGIARAKANDRMFYAYVRNRMGIYQFYPGGRTVVYPESIARYQERVEGYVGTGGQDGLPAVDGL